MGGAGPGAERVLHLRRGLHHGRPAAALSGAVRAADADTAAAAAAPARRAAPAQLVAAQREAHLGTRDREGG